MHTQEGRHKCYFHSSNSSLGKGRDKHEEKMKEHYAFNDFAKPSARSKQARQAEPFLFPAISNQFNFNQEQSGEGNKADWSKDSKQKRLEDYRVPPLLNETELIKQRNKIVDDYINDMDHWEDYSKAKPSNEEGQDDDDEDDAFLIAERRERREKKGRKDAKAKFPHCNSEHSNSSYQSTKEQYLINDKLISHNTATLDNNKWNSSNTDASSFFCKEVVKRKPKVALVNDKKRNQTAKNCNKLNLGDNSSSVFIPRINNRIKSFRPEKTFESKKKRSVYETNDSKNPYSVKWANKMLDKRYNMELELCFNGKANGIPGIKLSSKKDQYNNISKRQMKENLDKMKKKTEDANAHVMKQFNSSTKKFPQMKKDIQEESLENENDTNEDLNKPSQTLIEFPVIYKFFQQNH